MCNRMCTTSTHHHTAEYYSIQQGDTVTNSLITTVQEFKDLRRSPSLTLNIYLVFLSFHVNTVCKLNTFTLLVTMSIHLG